MPRSEETAGAIERFVDRQVDERWRGASTRSERRSLVKVVNFVEERFQRLLNDDVFENKVSEFLPDVSTILPKAMRLFADTFTPETVALLKSD